MYMSFEFLITSLIVVISPGTGAIYTIATGISRGTKASLIAAIACTLGIIPHIFIAILGLAFVFTMSSSVFMILKFLGVTYYYIWLGQHSKRKAPFNLNKMRLSTPLLKLSNTQYLLIYSIQNFPCFF